MKLKLLATTLVVINFHILGICGHVAYAKDASSIEDGIDEKRYLVDALKELSEKHHVIFSFKTQLLKGIVVDFEINDEESLEIAINRLLIGTGLNYKFLGSKYYVIYKNDKRNKKHLRKLSRRIQQIQNLERKGNLELQSASKKGSLRLSSISKSVQQLRPPSDKTLSGTVSNEKGEPLSGATVRAKGSAQGVLTDDHGRYSFSVPDEVSTLIISYIGYETQEVDIAGRATINVVLSESVNLLDEVVIVGYTSQDKADVTSAIASVDVKNMVKRSTSDVTQALQGNVTGVQIYATDQSPGAAFNFNIRGISSPEGASASPPLVIVDGVQISGLQNVEFENVVGVGDGLRQTTGLENINPNDIESIDILKDASAAAIYGSRAANGVILITTKRGERGSLKLLTMQPLVPKYLLKALMWRIQRSISKSCKVCMGMILRELNWCPKQPWIIFRTQASSVLMIGMI